MARFFVALTLLLAVVGCQAPSGEAPAEPVPPPTTSSTDAPERLEGPLLDDLARRLAGLETTAEDPAEAAAWAEHGAAMDAVWQRLETRHLEAMRDFARTTLAPRLAAPGRPLFYPFGGPDFLAAEIFFPRADSYLLVGLQPPGRPPRIDDLDTAGLAAELERLAAAFRNLEASGYFVTTQMDEDFAAERLDGVLPALLVFLARVGERPVHLEVGRFTEGGELVPAASGVRSNAAWIDFVSADLPADDPSVIPRRLIYAAVDLSNDGLAGSPGFVHHLGARSPWNVFMKSAEFLLHMEGFESLRDLLLAEAQTILQDDSGLPHASLDPAVWEREYFGVYSETQPAAYRKWFQDDLVTAFADAEPLGFAIGYHAQLGTGGLILAHRRTGEER